MTDCFISYSTNDSEIANKIYEEIEKCNIDVFLSERDLEGGDVSNERIIKALRDSIWTLVLVSEQSNKSQYVQQEIGAALRDKKKIIPILIDVGPDDLPAFLRKYQAIDLQETESIENQIEEAVEKIKWDKNIQDILKLGMIGSALMVAADALQGYGLFQKDD